MMNYEEENMDWEKDYETFKSLIRNNDDEASHTDYEMCRKCFEKNRVVCCCIFPCEIDASDLTEISESVILKLLETGLVTLDKWDGSMDYEETSMCLPDTYYLRMRSIEDKGPVYFGFGGECVAWSDKGCTLEFYHRPYYGRMESCKDKIETSSKFRSCKSWVPYQEILQNVVDMYLPRRC
jgi:hypothetical protein